MAAYIPIAISFGVLALERGLTGVEATLMSLIVYAGASQFAALAMMKMQVPVSEIVLAVLFINLRHGVMSLSLAPRLTFGPAMLRAAICTGLTDETFAVSSLSPHPQIRELAGFCGLVATAWVSWVGGTVLGVLAASLVPAMIGGALIYGLYGLFIGLLIPPLKRVPHHVWTALGAMALHLGARQIMPSGWAIAAAIVGGSLVGALLETRRKVPGHA